MYPSVLIGEAGQTDKRNSANAAAPPPLRYFSTITICVTLRPAVGPSWQNNMDRTLLLRPQDLGIADLSPAIGHQQRLISRSRRIVDRSLLPRLLTVAVDDCVESGSYAQDWLKRGGPHDSFQLCRFDTQSLSPNTRY